MEGFKASETVYKVLRATESSETLEHKEELPLARWWEQKRMHHLKFIIIQ